MSPRRLPFAGLLLLSGCLWPVQEKTDQAVAELTAHAFDVAPALPAEAPPREPAGKDSGPAAAAGKTQAAVAPPADVQTTALIQAEKAPEKQAEPPPPRLELRIPPQVPGSETPLIKLPPAKEKEAFERAVRRLYPELPPLADEPKPLPGPEGRPYTLADLQQVAAANSPALRQAASDVEAAKGNLIQAWAYPNPTIGWEVDPSNDGSTAGVQGLFIDQTIKTGGKLKIAAAAAQKDLDNAVLALRRARSDLATQVRNAYFALLVARETMVVNRALARFTGEVYRAQVVLLLGGPAAPAEPAGLRALAYSARLAHKQAIASYVYAWKQLVAVVGLRQLPLTEVAGRVDRLIPYYDYDTVRAHVLRNHTDVLAARNMLEKARYNLKLAQVTPVPDVEVRVAVLKEFALPPLQWVHTVQVGVPLPIWDKNKGNIIAAQAALVRATEESHRVEVALTNTLATSYASYKNNLAALEYYRRFILPDQVRYYRGILQRREVDPASAFGDLVAAQQALATYVTTYLTTLGSLWTSAVSVADLLQTDDLFQLGKPQELPPLPDLTLPPWACEHPWPPGPPHPAGPVAAPGPPSPVAPAAPPSPQRPEALPAPRQLEAIGTSTVTPPQLPPRLPLAAEMPTPTPAAGKGPVGTTP